MTEEIRSVLIKGRIELEAPKIPEPITEAFEATADSVAERIEKRFSDAIQGGMEASLARAETSLASISTSFEAIDQVASSAASALDGVATSADDIGQATDSAEAGAVNAADAIQLLKTAYSAAQASGHAMADDISEGLLRLIDILERVQSGAEVTEEEFASVAEEMEGLIQGAESINAVSVAQDNLLDTNIKVAESYKKIGEGAFAAATGVAFLTTSSDEEMQKMLGTIAKVQGAFNLFKGSTDVVVGLVEAVRAARAASAASAAAVTAANTAQAASASAVGQASLGAAAAGGVQATANTGVATTAGAATVAMTALQIAMGPIGIAILAISAVVAGVVSLFVDWGESEEELEERLHDTTDAINEQAAAARDLNQVLRTIASDASQDIANTAEGLGFDEEAQRVRLERLVQIEERRGEMRIEHQREMNRLIQQARANVRQGMREDVAHGEAIRQQFKFEAEQAQERVELAKEEQAIKEKNQQLTKQQIESDIKKNEEAQSSLDKAKAELDTIEQILEREQSRLQSIEERIGFLDEDDAQELERIQAKKARGIPLSRDDVRFVESKLGASNVADFTADARDRFTAERGGKDRFQTLLGGADFGESQEVADARAERRQLEDTLKGRNDIADVAQKLRDQSAAADRQTYSILTDMTDEVRRLSITFAHLQGAIRSNKANE